MRATTFSSLTAATVLAALVPLAPATASEGDPTDFRAADFRAAACRNADHEGIASGGASRATLLTQRLRPLGSIVVTGVRLTYANGVRCDVVSLDGRLPFGHDLKGYDAQVSERGTLVVAGVHQGETELRGIGNAVGGSPVRELDDEVLGAVVYATTESGTVPAAPGVPAQWQGQPYTFTHTRTTAEATLRLRKGVEKRFTVTRATRAAAARRLQRDLDLATSAADRRDARRTYRLALDGVRLAMKPLTAHWSGELPG